MSKGLALKQLNLQLMMCSTCAFVYNPRFGDPESNISSLTPFEEINEEEWHCPICNGSKDGFIVFNTHKEEQENASTYSSAG